MDIKVTSIKPTPGAVQDAVGLIFGALSRTPLGAVLPTIISGTDAGATGPRTFVNVTVVIVNDSNFGEVKNTAEVAAPSETPTEAAPDVPPVAQQAPAKQAVAKKAAAKKAVAGTPAVKRTTAKRAVSARATAAKKASS